MTYNIYTCCAVCKQHTMTSRPSGAEGLDFHRVAERKKYIKGNYNEERLDNPSIAHVVHYVTDTAAHVVHLFLLAHRMG